MNKYDNTCPNCHIKSLFLKKIKSAANPFKLQSKKYAYCKIVNIRKNTIFQEFSQTPLSILINSIEQFICEDKNASKTIEFLMEIYQLSSLGQKTIYDYKKMYNSILFRYL